MCLTNAKKIALSLAGWLELFPNGFPEVYTATDGIIDIEASLPNIARGKEKDFERWATLKNAELVQRLVSCRTRGIFPLLNSMLKLKKMEL